MSFYNTTYNAQHMLEKTKIQILNYFTKRKDF